MEPVFPYKITFAILPNRVLMSEFVYYFHKVLIELEGIVMPLVCLQILLQQYSVWAIIVYKTLIIVNPFVYQLLMILL